MSGSTRETPIRLLRCKGSAQGPIKASEPRLNTEEVVRSYHLYSLSFSLQSPVGFASDILPLSTPFCFLRSSLQSLLSNMLVISECVIQTRLIKIEICIFYYK